MHEKTKKQKKSGAIISHLNINLFNIQLLSTKSVHMKMWFFAKVSKN